MKTMESVAIQAVRVKKKPLQYDALFNIRRCKTTINPILSWLLNFVGRRVRLWRIHWPAEVTWDYRRELNGEWRKEPDWPARLKVNVSLVVSNLVLMAVLVWILICMRWLHWYANDPLAKSDTVGMQLISVAAILSLMIFEDFMWNNSMFNEFRNLYSRILLVCILFLLLVQKEIKQAKSNSSIL